MLSQVKLKRLFLPLVGIYSKAFVKNYSSIKSIGFKYKDIPYKMYRLYIRVSSLEILEDIKKYETVSNIYKEEKGTYVIELECINREKYVWDKLVKGKYKEIGLVNTYTYETFLDAEELELFKGLVKGDEDTIIKIVSRKINATKNKTSYEIAKDLYYSEKELFDRLNLIKKVTLEYV